MNKYNFLLKESLYLTSINLIFTLTVFKHITILNILFFIINSTIISSIISLIITNIKKEKTKKIIILVINAIITLLFLAQYTHYSFYDCFFSVYSLLNSAQVFGFISAIIKVIYSHLPGFLIILITSIAFNINIIKTLENKEKNKSVLIILLTCIILNIVLTITPSTKILIKTNNNETLNTKNFGLIEAEIIDTYRYITNFQTKIEKEDNYKFKKSDSKKYNVTNDLEKINTKNINNKNIKDLTNYLKHQTPTNKNKYTGVLKNKNIIFITAESLSFNVISKELTPTLYNLKENSIEFKNFYTPIYYASTSDGEYTNLTGLIPREGTWSLISTKDNYYPYQLTTILKKQNYSLNAYHNGQYNFYKRNEIMNKKGYQFKACGNGLEKKINCNIWPQSDIEMIEQTTKDYIKNDKFHAYYMSISMHLPHNYKTNDIAKKYKNKLKKENYSNTVKAYLSSAIEFDKSIEKLTEALKKENKLKDTVIVIVPDHYPYGLSTHEYQELKRINTEYDKHKSGLIIYNEALKKEKIYKYASNIDILPTLLNMIGAEYDSRLLIGKDIMSNI